MSERELRIYRRRRDTRGAHWMLVRALPYEQPVTAQLLEQWLNDTGQPAGVYLADDGENTVQVPWGGPKQAQAATASWGTH